MQHYRGGPQVTVPDGKSRDAKEMAQAAREQQKALLEMEEERKQMRKNRVSALVQQAPATRDKTTTTTTVAPRVPVAIQSSQDLLNRQFTNQTTLRPGRAVSALHPAYGVPVVCPPSPPSVAIPDDYMEIESFVIGASEVSLTPPVPVTPLIPSLPTPPPPPPSPVMEEVYDAHWYEPVDVGTGWSDPCKILDVDPVRVMRPVNGNWVSVQIPRIPLQCGGRDCRGRIRCLKQLPVWALPRREVAQVIEVIDDGESCMGVVVIELNGCIVVGPFPSDEGFFAKSGDIGVPFATTMQYVAASDDEADEADVVDEATDDDVFE